MSRALDFSVGELLGKSELADFYTRVEYDRSGNIIYTPLWLEDGEKKVVDFFSHYHIGNHNLSTSSIKLYIELFKSKSNFSILCERANKYNKTILGFLGSKYKQKFWLVKCNICDFEAVQDMNDFHRCKNCSDISQTKPFEQFRLEGCEKHSNKYSYDSSSYKNNKIKTKIFCNKCQIHFMQRPDNHLAGKGCPVCNESQGEKAILRYCIENNIRFERYKKFNGLIYKKQLILFCIIKVVKMVKPLIIFLNIVNYTKVDIHFLTIIIIIKYIHKIRNNLLCIIYIMCFR